MPRRRDPRRWVLRAGLCLLLAGCVRAPHVTVQVPQPASLPLFVFKEVWVTAGADEDERYLADRLAAHLARDARRAVRRASRAELKRARAEQAVPTSVVVVDVGLALENASQPRWETAPTQYCGVFGCYTGYQRYLSQEHALTATASASVRDGASGRVLQQERFRVAYSAVGHTVDVLEAVDALASKLQQASDVTRRELRFEWLEDGLPEAQAARELFTVGRLAAAERRLRAACGHSGLSAERRAALSYHLGLVHLARAQDGETSEPHLDAAARAFARASELAPRALYRVAASRVAGIRADYEAVRDQRRTAHHNFSHVADAP